MLFSEKEFQEIGHCGGQYTVNVKIAPDGRRSFQLGMRHSRPTPASFFAVYFLPQGIPVGMIQLGGIGQPWNPSPVPGSLSIFIASDTQGMFGHQCQNCGGYWRSKASPARWRMTCPYCGLRAESHAFLTDGQLRYAKACCDLIEQALSSDKDGESVVDMDKVADAVGKDCEKPKFYYAEQSQQNKYTCLACSELNDILGRYGYCSSCGTYNGVYELENDLKDIRDKITKGNQYEDCARDAVAAFDSFARQIAKQLAKRIPMTPARQKEWSGKLFHNIKPCADAFKSIFDIDVFKNFKQDEIDFVTIATLGNAQDFGDLTTAKRAPSGSSNATRGIFAGGRESPSPNNFLNDIDYITIASAGNSVSFGDLTTTRSSVTSCSSSTRGVFAGGYNPTRVNTIEYVEFATEGNAVDFGDLLSVLEVAGGCSNAHGGL